MEFQALLRFDSTVTVESLKGGHAGTFEKYEAYAVRDFVCIIVCGRVLAVHHTWCAADILGDVRRDRHGL